jgi:transposase-like protein
MGSQVLFPLQAVQEGRRLVAVDETVLKVNGQTCYLWAAIDVDTNEVLAVYASRGRGIPCAVKFLRKILDPCECKPLIVVDRGPWYRWALDRLGITTSTRPSVKGTGWRGSSGRRRTGPRDSTTT